jgi:hypothetical protein
VGLNAHRQTKMTRVSAVMAAADAAKEGGFIGFGGAEQVSAGEQQMLDQVRAALGVA